MTLDAKTRSVRLALPGMKLDLGAIGKGYADDEAQKVLRKFGITRALVEMGGDIVVSDPPPGAKGWTIEVPNAEDDAKIPKMNFANCAVSTSGDTEEFVIIAGETVFSRYQPSHGTGPDKPNSSDGHSERWSNLRPDFYRDDSPRYGGKVATA
jgi:thiamine biosynthesis lipoprotein